MKRPAAASEPSVKNTKPSGGANSKAFEVLAALDPGATLGKDGHNAIRSLIDTLERRGNDEPKRAWALCKTKAARDDFVMKLQVDPEGGMCVVEESNSLEVNKIKAAVQDWHAIWEVAPKGKLSRAYVHTRWWSAAVRSF